jgi:tellurite resistance protein
VRNYFADYSENSRSAILRAAIMVAHSDGSWHELERAQLEGVYRNICVMLDADLDDDLMLRELDEIATDVPDKIKDLESDEEREAFWEECLAPIVSRDIQQLAVAAALKLSGGDSEIGSEEVSGLARLCKAWDVNVKDAQEIWNE